MQARVYRSEARGESEVIDVPGDFWTQPYEYRANLLNEKFGKNGWESVYAL